jgi:hypothetical protein
MGTNVVAIWPEDMTLTPRAAALVDFAVEALGGAPDAGHLASAPDVTHVT